MEHLGALRTLTAPMAALSITGGAVLLLAYTWDWPGSRRSDMPPGNLLSLKPTNVYEQLRQLSLDYGPIVSLKIGSGTLIIIGGDGSQVRELYDKRGTLYSGRPLQMVTEIAGGGDHFLFQQDPQKWRIGRKQIVQHFAPTVMKNENVALQEAESVQLLHEFLHQPEDFMTHPMRYHDPIVQEVEDTMRLLSNLLVPGGKPPVEDFPVLNYLPEFVSPWKAKCKQLGQKMDRLYCDIGVQRGMQGLNTNNLAYKLRMGEEGTGLTRHQQAFVCGIVLEGGTDIVAAVILTCLLALINHPTTQKRAHEELDAMYDEETMPRWNDEQAMPFVRAKADDHYGGYFIPEGSQLLCVAWTIHTNAERYEEPEVFKPERFLNHSMSMAESLAQGDPLKRDHFAFGAGVSASTDFSTAFMGEGVRIPKKFPLVVTPRSQRRVQAIEEAMLSARDIFSHLLVAGGFTIVLAAVGWHWNWPGSRRKNMPPGPTPLPILGNVLRMKPVDIYAQFRELNDKYGPIVSLKVGAGDMIVIGGDGSLVRHLLDKRGAIYSNRPLQLATEIAGRGDALLFQQDTNKWRLARKQIVQHYASSVVKVEYVALQEAESVQLLYEFLHNPKRFMQHPMRFTTSVVTCLNYGVRCEAYEDPAVRGIEEVMFRVCELLMPGSKPPVEDFPWLRFIPDFISDWKAKSRKTGELMDKLYGVIFNIWAIHSNPDRFEDPKTFKPERFMNHKMSMAESIAQGDPFQRDHFAFGAGRRSCPGVQVAEQNMFIALSRLLWAFEFFAPPGSHVNIEQSAFFGETVRHPKEFPLVIKPRSERRKTTIEREMAHAKEHMFSQYGVYKTEWAS
ncbi:unnamed protein product [Rhizoctonia solani]|uniref:Steroid 17-alpha-hydroxylase/17,20 lyase n=1 Tax=Rhizoctonia solani TaxID=456999 RepID=A0A8H3CIM3_9AGAM|nr:unnamed protein product [Rhizoctonia solani]